MVKKQKQLIVKRKLEQMSFESTAEGRAGVDGVDRALPVTVSGINPAAVLHGALSKTFCQHNRK